MASLLLSPTLYLHRCTRSPIATSLSNHRHLSFPKTTTPTRRTHIAKSTSKDRHEQQPTPPLSESTSVAETSDGDGDVEEPKEETRRPAHDEELKKFLENPSIWGAFRLAKKVTDMDLEKLGRELLGAGTTNSGEELRSFEEKPSIETAVERVKKRVGMEIEDVDKVLAEAERLERKKVLMELEELERDFNLLDVGFMDNPFFESARSTLRDMLGEYRQTSKKSDDALDLNKLRSCFGYDTFFAVEAWRHGDGCIFTGNLRGPIAEVMPKLEKNLSLAAGREVAVRFFEDTHDDITKQACEVQPKSELDLELKIEQFNLLWMIGAVPLSLATLWTMALLSGFSIKPDATANYTTNVLPLFGGFLSIFGVSEIATRITAAQYGVKLSPSYLVPSIWTGCLGVINNYESVLPNKKACFDIPVARTASSYLTSAALAISAFIMDGSLNGGTNVMYIRPQFFDGNPLLSFVQYVVGHHTDHLGYVWPPTVEGTGVSVNPLAFAGLLGIVVTSLNLLPCGRLEGGRIARALFGGQTATLLSFLTTLVLIISGLNGSPLCLAWGLFAAFFRGEQEFPAKDEITPLGGDRYTWGFVLAAVCFFTLLPNYGSRFFSFFLNPTSFKGGF